MDPFCHTGKKQYESKAAAEDALRELLQTPNRPEHLTHKAKDQGSGPYRVRRKRDAKVARVIASLKTNRRSKP